MDSEKLELQKFKEQKKQNKIMDKILKEALDNNKVSRPVRSINPNLFISGKRADQSNYLTAMASQYSKKLYDQNIKTGKELKKQNKKKDLQIKREEKSKEKLIKNNNELQKKSLEALGDLQKIKSSEVKKLEAQTKRKEKIEKELNKSLFGKARLAKDKFDKSGGIQGKIFDKITSNLGVIGEAMKDISEQTKEDSSLREKELKESKITLIDEISKIKSIEDSKRTTLENNIMNLLAKNDFNMKNLSNEQSHRIIQMLDIQKEINETFLAKYGESIRDVIEDSNTERVKELDRVTKKYSEEQAELFLDSEEWKKKDFNIFLDAVNELDEVQDNSFTELELINENLSRDREERKRERKEDINIRKKEKSQEKDIKTEELIEKRKQEETLSFFQRQKIKLQEKILEKLENGNKLFSNIQKKFKQKEGDSGGLLSGIFGGTLSLLGSRFFGAAGGLLGKGGIGKVAGKLIGGAGIGSLLGAGGSKIFGAKTGVEKSVGQTISKKGVGKIGSKVIGKSILKKIPVVGAIAGAGFAIQRALKGDWIGAGGEILSGLASIVPGFGTAASVAIDAGLAVRDSKNLSHKKPNKRLLKGAAVLGGVGLLGNKIFSETPKQKITSNFNSQLGESQVCCENSNQEKTQLEILKVLKNLNEKTKINLLKEKIENSKDKSKKSIKEIKEKSKKIKEEKKDPSFFGSIMGGLSSAWNGAKNFLGFGDSSSSGPVGVAGNTSWGDGSGGTNLGSGIGSLVNKYETSGRGYGMVSSGRGDHGGVSYGTYQLSTTMGSAQAFTNGSSFSSNFAGLRAGTPQFGQMWKNLANNPATAKKFAAEQDAYAMKKYFRPAMNGVMKRTGVDLSQRSNAIKAVVLSTAVQHGGGGATSIISKAIRTAGGANASDKQIIDAIYKERGRKNSNGGLVHFKSSSAKVQRGVAGRFVNERKDAFAMLNNKEGVTSSGVSNMSSAGGAGVNNTPSTSYNNGSVSGSGSAGSPMNQQSGVGNQQDQSSGGSCNFSGKSLEGLKNAARTKLERLCGGSSLFIVSGYRSPAYNRKVGGAKNSMHMRGMAIDIRWPNSSQASKVQFINKAIKAGFRGIGIYPGFIHVDIGNARAWGPDGTRKTLPPWAAKVIDAARAGAPIESSAPLSQETDTGNNQGGPSNSGGMSGGGTGSGIGQASGLLGGSNPLESILSGSGLGGFSGIVSSLMNGDLSNNPMGVFGSLLGNVVKGKMDGGSIGNLLGGIGSGQTALNNLISSKGNFNNILSSLPNNIGSAVSGGIGQIEINQTEKHPFVKGLGDDPVLGMLRGMLLTKS